MADKTENDGDKSDQKWAFGVSCLVVLCLIVYLVACVSDPASRGSLLLSALVGGMVGWVLGILATPYNAEDSGRLLKVSGAAYAAISGFLLARLEPFFAYLLGSDTTPIKAELLPHIAFAIIMLIDAAVLTYVTRAYSWGKRRQKARDIADAARSKAAGDGGADTAPNVNLGSEVK